MVDQEGVHFHWPDGDYIGAEPSEFIYDKPAIARILREELFDKQYTTLRDKVNRGEDILSELEKLNVKYIILNRDIVESGNQVRQLNYYKDILNSSSSLEVVKTIGSLTAYKVKSPKAEKRIEIVTEENLDSNIIKNSNTHYTITIAQNSSPFTIILKNTFKEQWKAKINDQVLNSHEISHGYANQWTITKSGVNKIDILFEL